MSRGTVSGNGIVTEGLVLSLDAANARSYPGSGTTWSDLTPNGNSGTLTNGPTFSSANSGIVQFDGVDDFITGSDSSNFAFGTGNFSLQYWFYVNSFSGTGTPTIVDLRSNASGVGAGYADYIPSNKFRLYWSNSDRYISNININAQNWYNVAVTKTSSVVNVYFNSVLDGNFSDFTNFTEGGFRLARNVNTSGTSYLNGRISNVMIYKGRSLSPTEVLQNYNATKTRFGL